MQNQVVLVLIFLTGIILLIGSVFNWEILLGPKKIENPEREQEIRKNIRTPLIIRWMNWLSGAKYYEKDGKIYQSFDQQRNQKRILYLFLGLLIIILGIIALNSGKFS